MGMTAELYDSFQIRAVAQAACVSPSTLYRHFPSKDELLVACLEVWLTDLARVVHAELTHITDPVQRIRHVSTRITVGLTERPLLAHAFVRSYLLANSTALESDVVRTGLSSLFVFALGDDNIDRVEIGELLTDIWAVKMPALVQRRITLAELQAPLERSMFAAGLRLSEGRGSEETRPA
jgi:AcrR family transcriptional regulator